MIGGGGRGGLGRFAGGGLEATALDFAFPGGIAPAKRGLCTEKAEVEAERAGEESRESGDEERRSIWAEDNMDDSRSLEGTFDWEFVWESGRS